MHLVLEKGIICAVLQTIKRSEVFRLVGGEGVVLLVVFVTSNGQHNNKRDLSSKEQFGTFGFAFWVRIQNKI